LGCFWQIKNNTYAGFFGFVGFKNGFIRWLINWNFKPFLKLTKAMQILPM
jgi:hypothetical protein